MRIDLSGKTILVTGGAGFIGSNLCEVLLEKQNKVICMDNFATGKRENIANFLENPNFTLIEGDIRDLETCQKAMKNVDFVLHQAALGSVPRSINDPSTTNDVNINGFLNMLIASRDNGVKRLIYASSSSVYGDSVLLPKIEKIVGEPISPYAVTKCANEKYARVFSNIYGLEIIGLRYFNVFGKNQDVEGEYAAVIPKFLNKLINNEPPTIYGDGYCTRDFTHIDNVVQANLLGLIAKEKESLNTVYNVSFGEKNTLNDLVKKIKKYLSTYKKEVMDVEVIYGEQRKGDINDSFADITKIKQKLKYMPCCSLDDGLEKTIGWYWKNLKK